MQEHDVIGAGMVECPEHPQILDAFLGGGEGEQLQPIVAD
jgi:hypothetical protein